MSLLLCLCDVFRALIITLVGERKDAKTAKVNWVKSSTWYTSGRGATKDCEKRRRKKERKKKRSKVCRKRKQ